MHDEKQLHARLVGENKFERTNIQTNINIVVVRNILPHFYPPRAPPIPADVANKMSSAIFQGSQLSAIKSI